MAAAQQVSEYEPEIVRGEAVERPMPDTIHALLTARLVIEFATAMASGSLWVGVGWRVRTSAGNLRLPDLIAYSDEPPARVPENPPLVTIEIISPDERYYDVFEKCEEYVKWGTGNVWVVQPLLRRLGVYSGGELHVTPELTLPEFGVHIAAESLFAKLPK